MKGPKKPSMVVKIKADLKPIKTQHDTESGTDPLGPSDPESGTNPLNTSDPEGVAIALDTSEPEGATIDTSEANALARHFHNQT